MKCHVCGDEMISIVTNLPFKISDTSIVILKDIPVFQCKSCNEYLLQDNVLAQVDKILSNANSYAELEVIKYAA